MADRFDLSGKVALVTGGSRGLGREMVLAFAEAGADVIIASRKLDSCEATANEVRERTGRRALPVACHVGEWNQVEQLAETAYREFGKVDILVNNAGMSPIYDHVKNVTEALYDKVLDVNLKGPFRLTALVGTRMAEGGGGSIIMVSSTASLHPGANVISYAAAKAGDPPQAPSRICRRWPMLFPPSCPRGSFRVAGRRAPRGLWTHAWRRTRPRRSGTERRSTLRPCRASSTPSPRNGTAPPLPSSFAISPRA